MVGLWYWRKLHDTGEASNYGGVKGVRIIHGLNINQKNSYTCCKNLELWDVTGNAMIGRYGGCFEEGIWWVYGTGENCAILERLAIMEG